MKKNKILEALDRNVINKISQRFSDLGFVYKKGIMGFEKKINNYTHTVYIHKHFSFKIFTNPKHITDDFFYLIFRVYFETEVNGFEKWYKENISKTDASSSKIFIESLDFCIPLIEDVDYKIPEDFSPKQRTYFDINNCLIEINENKKYHFKNFGYDEYYYDFDFNFEKVLKMLNEQVNKEYDFEQIANENKGRLKHIGMLIYLKNYKLPIEYMTNKCEFFIAEIDKETDGVRKDELLKALDRFISLSDKLLELKILNPYK